MPLTSSSRRGFSLLEVLAALVVTAILMVALAPFAAQMLGSWTRGAEASRVVELKSRGIGRLRQDLKHAIVWSGYGKTENLIAFRGNESSMIFPASTGLGAGQYGLEMVSISVDTSFDGRALVRRRAPIVGSTYAALVDPVILFSGPFKFVFKYYSRGNKEFSVWTDATAMPSRVEIRIVDQRGQIFSTPIEIPVFASVSAGCFANQQLLGCPAVAPPVSTEDPAMAAFGLTGKTQ